MDSLLNALNIASVCASIFSFFIALFQLKKHHIRLALFFFFVCCVLYLIHNSTMFPPQNVVVQSKPGPTVEPVITKKDDAPQSRRFDLNEMREPPVDVKTADTSALQLHTIQSLLYSYSKDRWGAQLFGGNSYPSARLQFMSGLIVDPNSVKWSGSYQLENHQICLMISSLKIPKRGAMLADFYQDMGIGYDVELQNAVFTDYTMARTVMIYRTFSGDAPPAEIRKCFPVVRIPLTDIVYSDLHGQWQGSYIDHSSDEKTTTISMDMRLLQKGNKLYGSLVESDDSKEQAKSRWEIEGWILDKTVTFTKRNARLAMFSVSYVAPYVSDAKELSGTWFAGFEKGPWTLRYVGDFSGSAEDIFNPDANPPEKP
jgi:hypothetical protein